jgi:DNA polymerase IV
VPGYSQIRLFDNSERLAGLYQAMDKIRHKHGLKAVMKVYGMQLYERRKEVTVSGEGLPAKRLKSMYGH